MMSVREFATQRDRGPQWNTAHYSYWKTSFFHVYILIS